VSSFKKAGLTLGAFAAVTAIAGMLATFGAFSSTTSNPGNSFAAGTVTIGDNDGGTALYNLSNQKPAATTEKCIKVTYTGSLDSSVKLYSSAVTAGGQYVDLAVTSGTGTQQDCTDFAADASNSGVYSGTLKNFADTYTSYATGLADNPLAATKWQTNDAVTYRFRVTLQDTNSAQGATTGTHSFTWETQNQ
jgi:hypothetical protein